MRLLIVDDSRILRERLVGMLADLRGVEIIGQAQDTLEAIESIQKLNPNVVILDIRMPRGSGLEVLEAIKKKRDSLKVIVFTNFPYPQYRRRCMEAGADYFFDKHTEFEGLFDTIKNLVASFPKDQTKEVVK